jgi:sigma-70-like protein
VPITVAVTLTAFLPRSFETPPARGFVIPRLCLLPALREDFLRAVEVARAEGATVEEISHALGVSRERIHQLLR